MVAVGSPVGSELEGWDVAGEPWFVRRPAGRELRTVVVSSTPVSVSVPLAPPRPGTTRSGLAPLPVGRVVVGPRVRLPASTYRRRRAVAAGLVVGVVLVLWAALGVFGGGPLLVPERPDSPASRLVPGVTYVVQPGDTFWSIAARLQPGGDPRPLVDRLVAIHGGSTLHVGEHLRLPA